MSKAKRSKLKDYLSPVNYRRIIKMAKTPDTDDFLKNAGLVTGTVILAGVVGSLIFEIMEFIPM